jgi:lactase-phlorizin hydrolase
MFFRGASSWLKITPLGIRKLMNWIKDHYRSDLDIYITENGFSDFLGNLDDQHRIYYYKHNLNQLLKG